MYFSFWNYAMTVSIELSSVPGFFDIEYKGVEDHFLLNNKVAFVELS